MSLQIRSSVRLRFTRSAHPAPHPNHRTRDDPPRGTLAQLSRTSTHDDRNADPSGVEGRSSLRLVERLAVEIIELRVVPYHGVRRFAVHLFRVRIDVCIPWVDVRHEEQRAGAFPSLS